MPRCRNSADRDIVKILSAITIASIVLVILILGFISSVVPNADEPENGVEFELNTESEFEKSFNFDRFVYIGKGIKPKYSGSPFTSFVIYWVDIETKVIYFQLGTGNESTISPLLNSDGKPIIWDGIISK